MPIKHIIQMSQKKIISEKKKLLRKKYIKTFFWDILNNVLKLFRDFRNSCFRRNESAEFHYSSDFKKIMVEFQGIITKLNLDRKNLFQELHSGNKINNLYIRLVSIEY